MARISKTMTTLVVEGEIKKDNTRFLAVRDELLQELKSGKYPIRVDMSWSYESDPSGMPTDEVLAHIAELEETLLPALEKSNLALLAYQVTGEGKRIWSFYTRNLPAFETTLNDALDGLPLLPLEFYAEEDREYEAFQEVLELM